MIVLIVLNDKKGAIVFKSSNSYEKLRHGIDKIAFTFPTTFSNGYDPMWFISYETERT